MKKRIKEKELNDIVHSSYEKIWKFKGKKNQNWEDRIFKTYDYLKKRNKIFSELVTKDDYFKQINRLYHDELTQKEFTEKIIQNLCTIETFNFYFQIPKMYNFNKNLSLGKCRCYAFTDLPKRVAYEFLEWTKIIEKNEYSEDQEYRIEELKQTLFLKIVVKGIGYDKCMAHAEEIIEQNMNILRYLFESNIHSTMIVVDLFDRHYVDAAYGDFTQRFENIQGHGRYDLIYENEFKKLSDIFKKKSPTDLEARIKRATCMFGTSLTISFLPLRLIALCSGLESLVVSERQDIRKQISIRITDILNESNNALIQQKLVELYKKRNLSVHQPTSICISDDDIQECQKFLKFTISNMLKLLDDGYKTLDKSKPLSHKFGWG
ncbi:MAG: hypothetical protein ACW9W3_00960 [Candidatus Nitrosopumilus sp. bin_68KS]